jgi:hypothetical protein
MSKIEIKIDASGLYEQYINDGKSKKIHLACFASLNQKSHCWKIFKELLPSLEEAKVISSIERVIGSQEVGSLFPYANLSILPPLIDGKQHHINLVHFISELIMEANEKYIKSGCIVFLLDEDSVNYKPIQKAIEAVILENTTEIKWLKTLKIC